MAWTDPQGESGQAVVEADVNVAEHGGTGRLTVRSLKRQLMEIAESIV